MKVPPLGQFGGALVLYRPCLAVLPVLLPVRFLARRATIPHTAAARTELQVRLQLALLARGALLKRRHGRLERNEHMKTFALNFRDHNKTGPGYHHADADHDANGTVRPVVQSKGPKEAVV